MPLLLIEPYNAEGRSVSRWTIMRGLYGASPENQGVHHKHGLFARRIEVDTLLDSGSADVVGRSLNAGCSRLSSLRRVQHAWFSG
jgi:hypothetical protein